MIRALLSGRKSQTRLLANKTRKVRLVRAEQAEAIRSSPAVWRDMQAGDTLWVRETLALNWAHDQLLYRADGRAVSAVPADVVITSVPRSSLYMPSWAARLWLIVRDVRIGPLQPLSEDDAIAEGITRVGASRYALEEQDRITYPSAVAAYRKLWSASHNRAGQRWEDNPEAVALTFDTFVATYP